MPVRLESRQPSPGSLGFLLAVLATAATREYLARAVTCILNHPITEVPFVHNVEMVERQSTVMTSTQSGNCPHNCPYRTSWHITRQASRGEQLLTSKILVGNFGRPTRQGLDLGRTSGPGLGTKASSVQRLSVLDGGSRVRASRTAILPISTFPLLGVKSIVVVVSRRSPGTKVLCTPGRRSPSGRHKGWGHCRGFSHRLAPGWRNRHVRFCCCHLERRPLEVPHEVKTASRAQPPGTCPSG